jgi:hypothetical protein
MPRREWSIGPHGPIIDVRIWIGPEYEEALIARGLPVSTTFSTSGLLDTGAQVTAVERTLADAMNLPVHDWLALRSSVLGEDEREAPVYSNRMTFGPHEATDPPRWRIIRAVGVAVVSPGASVLIGQDLLATCRFTYDGRKRRLMMSY